MTKISPPLADITALGPWKVRCWESCGLRPGLLYGKIGPLDPEFTADMLITDAHFSEMGAILKEFLPLPPLSDGSRFFRLAFQGSTLPSRLLFGHQSLRVAEYRMPAVRCRNCYLFGHGAMACRRKVRCANCSGFHPFQSLEGDRCTNNSFCFFCHDTHRLANRSCPALLKAENIAGNAVRKNLVYKPLTYS